jgi:uncharacterized protein YceK
MKRLPIALAAALLALALSGCGTVCNLANEDPQPYGGVVADVQFAFTPVERDMKDNGAFVFLGLVAADVALSLVGDTITLPLAIYLRQ